MGVCLETEMIDKLEGIYRDLAVTGVELGVLVAGFILINGAIRFVFSRVRSVLPGYSSKIDAARQAVRSMLLLAGLVLGGLVMAFNGYLIYRQTDVYEFTRVKISQIPDDFWVRLWWGVAQVVVLIIAAPLMIRGVRRVLKKLEVQAKAYDQIRANDQSIDRFFTSLNQIQCNGLWLLVALWSCGALLLPAVVGSWVGIILRVYVIISVGVLVIQAVAAIVESLDALGKKYAKPGYAVALYKQLRRLIPLLRRCLEYAVYVIVASLAMHQIELLTSLADYGPKLVQIIGIFFLVRVFIEITNLVVDRSLSDHEGLSQTQRQRQNTFVPIVKNLMGYVIYFFGFVLMLRSLDFNPLPVLAGAGIAGIVLGLGAQPLINDIVSGIFILFEDLYLVGDYIEAGSAQGTVETIQLRTTRVRDPDGQLHIIRNGQLGNVDNYSKGYTFAVVEVGVAYDTDLDHAYRVLAQVGEVIMQESQDVLEPTLVQGLENFGESDMLIRTLTRVKPGRHRDVTRRLRKLVKDAFDQEGIEIPFARRVVIFQNKDSDAAKALLSQATDAQRGTSTD